jgi:hypothetical protein
VLERLLALEGLAYVGEFFKPDEQVHALFAGEL